MELQISRGKWYFELWYYIIIYIFSYISFLSLYNIILINIYIIDHIRGNFYDNYLNLIQYIIQFYNSIILEIWILINMILKTHIIILIYNLWDIYNILYNNYIGIDISERKKEFEDLEYFHRKRESIRIWKFWYFI